MSHLAIKREPGGRRPGWLHCDCGITSNVIYTQVHGTFCPYCRQGFRFLGLADKPGSYELRRDWIAEALDR